jgi:small-conductance mechanosensitive channel
MGQRIHIGSLCALFLLLALVPSASMSADSLYQVIAIDTTRRAPVMFEDDTLFIFSASLRGMPVERRALLAEERIRTFAENEGVSPEMLTIETSETGADITANGGIIVSVFDVEAVLEKTTSEELAGRRLAAIRDAVSLYRSEREGSTIAIGIVVSVLATLVLVLILRKLASLHTFLASLLNRSIVAALSRKWEFLRVEWLERATGFVAGSVKWFLIAVVLYGYLQIVLSRFVWTRDLAQSVLDLTLHPLFVYAAALRDQLPNIFFLFVLALITRYVLKFTAFFFREVARGALTLPNFRPEWATHTYKLVRLLILAFSAVVAFPYIPGSNSPAFQGISIFLGVLFSLGSSSTVSNVVAGFVITYMGSFRVGDYVQVGETVGTILSQGMLVTRVRTPKNVDVTIPNSNLIGVHLVNYSTQARERRLILHTKVTIGYDTPWRQIHALLRKAAQATPDILKDPEPFVLQTSLDDFYVSYELNAYTDNPVDQPRIYSDLHRNIQDAFNEFGVQIMSPNYIADRPRPTVVPRDQWYAPPAPKPGEPDADS